MGNYLYRRNGGTGYTNVHDIEYDVTNDIWQDASSSAWPTTFGTSATDSTPANPQPDGSASTLYLFDGNVFTMQLVHPNPIPPGPTVSSITPLVIFTTDTVANTDFTLLQNGSAYANTNISF